ncbi:MAG TPA: hypothetical protein VF029_03775 [Actinomycetota bacterium]
MLRIVVGLFLIAHGLVHLLYLGPRPEDDPRFPFVPEDRWFARAVGLEPGGAKAVAGGIAIACALVLLVSGIALFVDADLWEPTAAIGAVISLVVLLLFFHRWLLIGIAIDVAILASVWSLHVPASLFEE